MIALRAPADGEEIARVVATPVVEGAAPAVELYVDLVAVHRADRRRADEVRILAVHRLQLLTLTELVERCL